MPYYKQDISENSFEFIVIPTGGTYFPPVQPRPNSQDLTDCFIVYEAAA
jgi:hypothetical protein